MTVASSIQQDTAEDVDTLNAVLTHRYDWFTRFSVLREREGSDWLGLRGHVQDVLNEDRYFALVDAPLCPEQCDVFLCGNPGMIRSVQPLLEHQGFSVHDAKYPGNLHVERY